MEEETESREEELIQEAEAVVEEVRRRAGLVVSKAGGGDGARMAARQRGAGYELQEGRWWGGEEVGRSVEEEDEGSRPRWAEHHGIGPGGTGGLGEEVEGWSSNDDDAEGRDGGWCGLGFSPAKAVERFAACGETPPTLPRSSRRHSHSHHQHDALLSSSKRTMAFSHDSEGVPYHVGTGEEEVDAALLLRRWIDGDVACSVESLLPLDRPRRSLSSSSGGAVGWDQPAGGRASWQSSEGGGTTDEEGVGSRWQAMFGRGSVRRSVLLLARTLCTRCSGVDEVMPPRRSVSSGTSLFEATPLARATKASSRRAGAGDYLRAAEEERRAGRGRAAPGSRTRGSATGGGDVGRVMERRHEELAERRRERAERQYHLERLQQQQQVPGPEASKQQRHAKPPRAASSSAAAASSRCVSSKGRDQRRLQAEMRCPSPSNSKPSATEQPGACAASGEV